MKVIIFLYSFIFTMFLLVFPAINTEIIYTLNVSIGFQNNMRVKVVDDLLKDANASQSILAFYYEVGDEFPLEIMNITETQEKVCFYTLQGEIDTCYNLELWYIKFNQYLPFLTSYDDERNETYENIYKDPLMSFPTPISPLPGNEYLTEAFEYKEDYSVKENIVTKPGHERLEDFIPTEEVCYNPNSGWLTF